MDEFFIKSAAGSGGLLFFERFPKDRAQTIESFWVRISGLNLEAAVQVYADYHQLYAGYHQPHPALLFADMARQWSGWSDPLYWRSIEEELTLECDRDHLGHIAIHVDIRPGFMPNDWRVK